MFRRLAGTAAGRIHPWIKVYKETDQFTVRNFFQQMEIAFGDPRRREKALERLNEIR